MPLTPPLSETPRSLLAWARTELGRRLQAGDFCRAETFLSEFPTLNSEPELALDLIVCEFQLRRELGEVVDPDAWCARFPQWQERLRGLLSELILSSQCSTVDAHGDAAAAEAGPTTVLDRLQVIRELGHGGMGVVFEVRDPDLDRRLALKMIRDRYPDPAVIERFRREARVLARLRHPHIVEIFAVGQYDGQPCYTMPLLASSLIRQIAAGPTEPRAAVALLEKVARAVHTAHAADVIHRDLKPGNILLDESGAPQVADFGLAKQLDADADMTVTGGQIGTPAYMAPEQAAGHAASRASDIWSLGVILYEVLTGRRPFVGSMSTLPQQIISQEPTAPRALQPQLSRELEAVLLKCLEKDPARRYPTAEALADDLGRWLRGELVPPPLPSRLRRVASYLRRSRLRLAGVAFLVLLLATASAVAWRVSRSNRDDPSAAITLGPQLPDRPLPKALVDIHNELKSGVPAILLDDKGRERWYRWAANRKHEPLVQPLDDYQSITSDSLCLCELLDDPQGLDYSISAEVQLESPRGNSRAGIYLMAEESGTGRGGTSYRFLSLCLDRQSELATPAIRCDLEHNCEPRDTGEAMRKSLATSILPLASVNEWHTLQVRVSADGARFFADNDPVSFKTDKPLDDRVKILENNSAAFKPLRRRGALGLLVFNGTGRFRNVKITPAGSN